MQPKCQVCKSNDGKFYEQGFYCKGKRINYVCGKCLNSKKIKPINK